MSYSLTKWAILILNRATLISIELQYFKVYSLELEVLCKYAIGDKLCWATASKISTFRLIIIAPSLEKSVKIFDYAEYWCRPASTALSRGDATEPGGEQGSAILFILANYILTFYTHYFYKKILIRFIFCVGIIFISILNTLYFYTVIFI